MTDEERANAINIAANKIERLAFDLPPTNTVTPQIVEEVMRLRTVANDIKRGR